jgi:hypothetical protein
MGEDMPKTMSKSKKLELSKEDIALVKKSIEHWKRDIQAKFKMGLKPRSSFCWSDGRELKDWAKYCPLCLVYIYNNCEDCPYYKYYGKRCTDRHYAGWKYTLNIRTCNAMIKALERIINI